LGSDQAALRADGALRPSKFQQSRELLQGSYDYATSHHADFTDKAATAIQKAIDSTLPRGQERGGRIGESRCRARTGF